MNELIKQCYNLQKMYLRSSKDAGQRLIYADLFLMKRRFVFNVFKFL